MSHNNVNIINTTMYFKMIKMINFMLVFNTIKKIHHKTMTI